MTPNHSLNLRDNGVHAVVSRLARTLGIAMPPYNWTCHSCEAVNAPALDVCSACGFPALAQGRDIEAAKSSRAAGRPISPDSFTDLRSPLRRWIDSALKSEVRIATLALALATLGVVAVSWDKYSSADFIDGIRVEAHGMLLDIVVIGIFILWLNLKRQESERLLRYEEEIDDFREWKSEEASYRIAGRIRRLNAAGRESAFLSRCHLRRAILPGIRLSNTPMHQVDLGEANLRSATLDHVNLDTAFLGYSDLRGARITRSNLVRARLVHCKADGASFRGSNLRKAAFNGARLRGSDFRECDLTDSIFDGADLGGADLRDAKGLTAAALSRSHSLSYTRFDAELLAALKALCPDLLTKNRRETKFQPRPRDAMPNPSLKRSANGKPPGPASGEVNSPQAGPGGSPSSPA